MSQLVLYLVIGSVLLYFAFSRGSMRGRSLKAVANQLGLEAFDRSLDGEVDGYRITTEYVRRPRRSNKRSRGIVLEIKLHTAPEGLSLEAAVVEGDDDARAWLEAHGRREVLAQLAQWVDSVSLSDRWLEIELSTDPLHAGELRETLDWLVKVGHVVDNPASGRIPQPTIHRHHARGCVMGLILGSILSLGSCSAVLAVLLFADPAEETPVVEEEPLPTHSPELEFIDCVNDLPETADADATVCEGLLNNVRDQTTPDVLEARRTLGFRELRAALRLELDPNRVKAAVEKLEELGLTEREVTELAYDSGLLDEYVSRAIPSRTLVLPDAAISLNVMLHSGTTLNISGHAARYTILDAARCLEDQHPRPPKGNTATELYTACGRTEVSTRYIQERGGRLAALEREPEWTLMRTIAHPRGISTTLEFQIAVVALQLTAPEWILEGKGFKLGGVFSKLEQPECVAPWSIHEASLSPETLVAALPDAGPMAPRFRLWAARQFHALGRFDEMHEVLAGIKPADPEVICAAQLETAAAKPEAAVARLSAMVEDENLVDVDRALALAHAYALLGDWKQARVHAVDVLNHSTHGDMHSSAAIVATVAASELGEPDLLDELFGPIPDPTRPSDEQSFEYPVNATRWFARAVSDAQDDQTDRWLAPSKLPLLQGSEWLQLYVASKLAPVDKVDFWLDSLLPTGGFDPYGLMEARRMTAERRGDDTGLARWTQLQKEHQARIQDVSDVRLMRIIRRLSPGSK